MGQYADQADISMLWRSCPGGAQMLSVSYGPDVWAEMTVEQRAQMVRQVDGDPDAWEALVASTMGSPPAPLALAQWRNLCEADRAALFPLRGSLPA